MREHPTVRKTPVAETPAALAPPTCRFDADRDLAFAHDAPGFGDVLHVFDASARKDDQSTKKPTDKTR